MMRVNAVIIIKIAGANVKTVSNIKILIVLTTSCGLFVDLRPKVTFGSVICAHEELATKTKHKIEPKKKRARKYFNSSSHQSYY